MRLYRGTKELESTAGRYWTSDIELARSYGHIVYRVDLVSTDPEVSNLIVGTDQAYPMYDITSYRIDFYAADWWAYRLDSDRAVNVFTNRAIMHEYHWPGR